MTKTHSEVNKFIVLINQSLSKYTGICPISNISVSINAVSGEDLTETG